MVKTKKHKLKLKDTFLGLQNEMALTLGNARVAIGHPGTKGDVTENKWRTMLSTYLPRRYSVEKAFIVDSDGNISDQIDLVIFDRQYSPFLLHEDGACYIPVESVYAVFEIKQEASKENITYAGGKAASVRNLKRTSARIIHAGGKYKPIVPKDIIAGLLCLKSSWKDGLPGNCTIAIKKLQKDQRLDLVCILENGAVSITKGAMRVFQADQALIRFFLSLLAKLQEMGSVPAMDIAAYSKSLDK